MRNLIALRAVLHFILGSYVSAQQGQEKRNVLGKAKEDDLYKICMHYAHGSTYV